MTDNNLVVISFLTYSLIIIFFTLRIVYVSSASSLFTFSWLGSTCQVSIIIILGRRRIDITINENMSHYRHITQSHSPYVANTYSYIRFDLFIQGSIDLVRDAVRHDPKYRRFRQEYEPTEDLSI